MLLKAHEQTLKINTMPPLSILVVDDHALFRLGLQSYFKQFPDWKIAGEANCGEEALRLVAKVNPDLICLDINLPDINGIRLARLIQERFPQVRMLALSAEEEETTLLQLAQSGVTGFVSKSSGMDELATAIQTIINGKSYFPIQIHEQLRKRNLDERKSDISKLTDREWEILAYIASGLTNKEIGGHLFISPRTVETHKRNLIQKLQAKNTIELVKFFFDWRTSRPQSAAAST